MTDFEQHIEGLQVEEPRIKSVINAMKNYTLRSRSTTLPQSSFDQRMVPISSEDEVLSKSESEIDRKYDQPDSGELEITDFECSLCFRLFCKPVTSSCGHTYCR